MASYSFASGCVALNVIHTLKSFLQSHSWRQANAAGNTRTSISVVFLDSDRHILDLNFPLGTRRLFALRYLWMEVKVWHRSRAKCSVYRTRLSRALSVQRLVQVYRRLWYALERYSFGQTPWLANNFQRSGGLHSFPTFRPLR